MSHFVIKRRIALPCAKYSQIGTLIKQKFRRHYIYPLPPPSYSPAATGFTGGVARVRICVVADAGVWHATCVLFLESRRGAEGF
jgi:hypothetical protein